MICYGTLLKIMTKKVIMSFIYQTFIFSYLFFFSNIRKDARAISLLSAGDVQELVYHLSCYEKYTHKNVLKKIVQKENTAIDTHSEDNQDEFQLP